MTAETKPHTIQLNNIYNCWKYYGIIIIIEKYHQQQYSLPPPQPLPTCIDRIVIIKVYDNEFCLLARKL